MASYPISSEGRGGKRPGTRLLTRLLAYKRCTRTFQNHSVNSPLLFLPDPYLRWGALVALPNMNGTPQSTPGEIQNLKNIREKPIESGPKHYVLSFRESLPTSMQCSLLDSKEK